MTSPNNLPFDPSEVSAVPTPAPTAPPVPPAPAPSIPVAPASAPSIQAMPRPAPAPAPAPAPTSFTPASSAPALPKEPEDIFGEVDHAKTPSRSLPPAPMRMGPSHTFGKTVALVLSVIVILALAGGLFWFFLIRDQQPSTADVLPISAPTIPESVSVEPVQPIEPAAPASVPVLDVSPSIDGSAAVTSSFTQPVPITTPPEGVNIPPPTPVEPTPSPASMDTDNDGLNDQRETELGTDPQKTDTDGDALSDGDEVLKYGTNPVNRDTDGDGYGDGSEIGNRYNPRGPGTCAKQDCTL